MKYSEEGNQLQEIFGPKSGQANTVQGELLKSIDILRREGKSYGSSSWDDKYTYHCNYIWSILGTKGYFDDQSRAEIRNGLNRIIKDQNLNIEDSTYDRLSDYITEWCMEYKEPIRIDNKNVKVANIIISLLYLAIGFGDLLGGATTDSRFYSFDDMFLRFIGLVLIVSSAGLFFRKEVARKGVILALSLSVVEIFLGLPLEMNIAEMIVSIIFLLVIYGVGLVFLNIPKVKECYSKLSNKGLTK